jgi:hypothetical protein
MCTFPLVKAFCRESYNQPRAVYAKLDAAEALRSRSDFFLSEEVTCTLPGGTGLHVGVYDVTERDHLEKARRANHVFSALTGRRTMADFRLFESVFPVLETHNGPMLARPNENAAAPVDFAARVEVGGSDAHAMASVGCAFTVVPRARTRQEYLEGLRRGLGRVRGQTGGPWKLTRDILSLGRSMVRDDPRTLAAAPLALAVPAITLSNCVIEQIFARWWMARYRRLRPAGSGNCAATPMAEVAA